MELIRRRLMLLLELHPSLVILLGLLNGILAFYYYCCKRFSYTPVFSLFISLSIFLFLKFYIKSDFFKNISKFVFFSLLGLLVAYISFNPSGNDYILQLPRENCSGEIKVRICDTTDPSSQIEWMPRPKFLIADVLELRISQKSKWKKSKGLIAVEIPKTLQSPDYGELVILKGAFIEPDTAIFKGDFDYKNYLLSKGIRKLFYASSMERKGYESSLYTLFFRNILKFRNRSIVCMTKGMNLENRKILAAIMFGCRHGVDFEIRKNFLQSGVIHIFAVSGLHVGMLAFSLFLFFRWIPFRLRYLIVPSILLIYVFTTGMQPSALRAFLMIGIWSLMKAFFYKTSPLNIIYISASIMLIINPLSILSPGFQFSFTIAFFLILSWNSLRELNYMLIEKQNWIPADLQSYLSHLKIRLRRGLFNSFYVSFFAWLSGTALLFFHRSLFIPGAVFTNFFIIPFVWLLFVIALINFLIIPFHLFVSLNFILDVLLDIIRDISLLGSAWGGHFNIITPPIWLLIIFFICLALFIITKKGKFFLISGLGLFLIISFCCFRKSLREPHFIIFHGGESQKAAVIFLPSGIHNGVTVINPGSKKRTKCIASYLKKNGINVIDYMIFTENRKSCCEGAWYILNQMQVKQIIFPPGYTRSSYAKLAFKNALSKRVNITLLTKNNDQNYSVKYSDPFIEFNKKNDFEYKIEMKCKGGNFFIEEEKILDGEKEITFGYPEKIVKIPIINSNRLRLKVLE